MDRGGLDGNGVGARGPAAGVVAASALLRDSLLLNSSMVPYACPLGVMVATRALAAPERLPPSACLPSISFLPLQFAFNTLQRVSPVSHGVCNVVKRIAIIFSSVFFFHQVRAQPKLGGSGLLKGMQAWRDRCRGLGGEAGFDPCLSPAAKGASWPSGGGLGAAQVVGLKSLWVGWGGGGTQAFGWRLCVSFVSHLSPGHVRYGRG